MESGIGTLYAFFPLCNTGEVKYARNNQAPVTLMHVDRTLPLWAFFDVYGNIQKVQILGKKGDVLFRFGFI